MLNKNARAALTNAAMHEQVGMIQLFAIVKCPFFDTLLQQIAESYTLAHASLSKLMQLSSCSVEVLPPYLLTVLCKVMSCV